LNNSFQRDVQAVVEDYFEYAISLPANGKRVTGAGRYYSSGDDGEY
jgi:hypothetical protein